jgi:hypothetical protein
LNLQNLQNLQNPNLQALLLQNPINLINLTRGFGGNLQAMFKPQMPEPPVDKAPRSNISTLNEISYFVENSDKKIDEHMPLFQSLSSFFYTTLQQNSPIRKAMKEIKQIKQPLDILKEYTNNETYKDLCKTTINSLYSDIRHHCSVCGFRTVLYNKLVEHLDIHFNINYIKRSSQKKVLYRRESFGKNNWINVSSNTQGANSTLNSVLYYLNDTELMINNSKASKNQENHEDNEQYLYPIQSEEINCFYCGEEFKKKYVSKFHFWFYVNVIKINESDVEIEGIIPRNKVVLVHDNCIEEFISLVSQKNEEKEKLLNKKRMKAN